MIQSERRQKIYELVQKNGYITYDKISAEMGVTDRTIRRDVNDSIKALEKAKECSEDESKKGLDDAQKLTDKFIKRIDEILADKEKEIMEV